MACALPVIATKAGTRDLLIDGVTGLNTWRYSFMIRRKLRTLFEDEELRARLGKAARKNVENFDWNVLARNIERYLMESVNV